MSIRVMAAVYDSDLTDVYEVAVMLALANHCDDDGRCYPSMRRICELARVSDRTAQRVVKKLVERGYICIEQNAGPKGTNVYFVHATPVQQTPRPADTPVTQTPDPRPRDGGPPVPVSPEPSIEPSIEPSVPPKTPKAILAEVAGAEAAASFIAFRKQARKPVSVTAATRLAKTLTEILNRGGDPADALGMAEERGWQAIKADWYFRDAQPRQSSHPDPEAHIVDAACRLAEASRADRERGQSDPFELLAIEGGGPRGSRGPFDVD